MRITDNVVRIHRPPQATLGAPHAQLHWIFGQLEAEQDNARTAATHVYAKKKYFDFLFETSAYYDELTSSSRFELSKYWEADALVRFNRWLNSQRLASKTKYSIYKRVRSVMDYAYALRILDLPVYHAPMFKGVIETEQRTAYSPEQQDFVNSVLARWISLAISVVEGYVPTGRGVPYRALGRRTAGSDRKNPGSSVIAEVEPETKETISSFCQATTVTVEGIRYASISKAAIAYGLNHGTVATRLRSGWTPEQAVGLVPAKVPMKDERALLWMFENEYECDSLRMLLDFKSRGLSAVATEADFRRHFLRWGVWPYVDDRLVMPLATELAMLTGLNVESLKSLTLDSYQPSHPLTHQAALRFSKVRAGSSTKSSELELHLSTLENHEVYIDGENVEKVHRLFLLIVSVTAKIRPFASAEIQNKLLIFEDVRASRREGRKVIVDYGASAKADVWHRRFKRESGFAELFGKKVNFNVAKCRPTLVTNMVLEGASMTRVQAVLTHADIRSTVMYLSERQLRPQFNKTMSEALAEISRRSKSAVERGTERSISADTTNIKQIRFHETLSGAGCSDPFNPSDNVRKASNYVPGSVCKFWNMCLLCDSSLVTENSLPKLIVYRRRVKAAIDFDSPAIQPKLVLLKQVDELLDGILEPDSIFPRKVLDAAEVRAASLDDVMADMLIYQGL